MRQPETNDIFDDEDRSQLGQLLRFSRSSQAVLRLRGRPQACACTVFHGATFYLTLDAEELA